MLECTAISQKARASPFGRNEDGRGDLEARSVLRDQLESVEIEVSSNRSIGGPEDELSKTVREPIADQGSNVPIQEAKVTPSIEQRQERQLRAVRSELDVDSRLGFPEAGIGIPVPGCTDSEGSLEVS